MIFPFEEPIYRDAGVPVEFVGHPLVDLATPATPRAAFLTAHGLVPDAPTIALLPGSRANEVSRILPDLIAAAPRIRGAVQGAQFVIARARRLDDALFRGADRSIRVIEGDTDSVLAASDVALTASGTATVQAALHDTPMVIVHRLSPLTYRLGRRLVRVQSIGMVNLIAGEPIVPELVQDAFTPDAVAREAIEILGDPGRAARVRAGLARVRQRLGGPGASRRAASAILTIAATAGVSDLGPQR